MNKKAISQIMVSILLIIIVLIIIPAFYIGVKKLIKDPLTSPQISCPDLQTLPPIKIIKACYNQETQDNEITLSQTSDYKPVLIGFIVDFGQANKQFQCSSACSTCKISAENSKKYYIYSNQKPNEISLLIDGCEIETMNVVDC